MFPAEFDYVRPASLDEALALLGSDDVKVIAGGHSLLPAMRLRLSQPQKLVDIGRLGELRYLKDVNMVLCIGALTSHYEIETSDLVRSRAPALQEAAAVIGDVQVRNKGTIGGSLAHADPAADYPAALIALNAVIRVRSRSGRREIAAREFFAGTYTTVLQPGELVTEICIPDAGHGSGQAYAKLRRRAADFATVGVCACLQVMDGRVQRAGIGVTGVGPQPYAAEAAVAALLHGPALPERIAAAAALVCQGVDVSDDLMAPAAYRSHAAAVYAREALTTALTRARG